MSYDASVRSMCVKSGKGSVGAVDGVRGRGVYSGGEATGAE